MTFFRIVTSLLQALACYRLELDERVSWDVASFTCRAKGARLLEIRSRREYNALTHWVTGHNLWLGSTTSKTMYCSAFN